MKSGLRHLIKTWKVLGKEDPLWAIFSDPGKRGGRITKHANTSDRKSLIESLPLGMGRLYRRWRHGSSAAFEVFYTPSLVVEAAAATAGLKLIHPEPDPGAGPNTEGFFYIFRKS